MPIRISDVLDIERGEHPRAFVEVDQRDDVWHVGFELRPWGSPDDRVGVDLAPPRDFAPFEVGAAAPGSTVRGKKWKRPESFE